MTDTVEPGESPEIAPSGHQGSKSRWDAGFKRNMLLIGAVALVVGSAVVVGLSRVAGSKSQSAPSRLEVGGGRSAASADNLTPEMERKIAAKQREEAADAAASNRSYVPPDAPPITQQVPQAQRAPAQNQYAANSISEVDQRRREGLQRQLAALLDSPSDNSVRQSVAFERRAAASAQPASAASAPAAPDLAKRTLIPGLEIVPAELSSDLKVPANGQAFASARVTAGPAAGAYLVGSAKVVAEGLEITFNQMRLGSKVYAIDALVLDESTASNSIQGNVDRHVLARYVYPVALAMAQGFFQAKSQTGSTTVALGNTTLGGVVTPAPTLAQAQAAGVSAGLQIASREVQAGAREPITVSREKSYPVGILFRQPVAEEAGR